MELKVRVARQNEYETVKNFYYGLIDKMQNSEYHPKWQKGIYPEDEYMRRAVEQGQMYLTECDGRIIGAMIINHNTTDGYERAHWSIKAEKDEVTVIHALGVMPDFGNRGVGKFMVGEVMKIAEQNGQKTVRLDVLAGNLPAEKLYKSMGFSFVERVKLFYEDTGLCSFDLYEYNL